jgi:hexosaminidase
LIAAELVGIPTVPYRGLGSEQYTLSSVKSIVVDSKYANAVDNRGSTLIPPTLKEFATTFAEDLDSVLGLDIPITSGDGISANSIFITLGSPGDYLLASGAETSEGYSLVVNNTGITIVGASPLGAWWGTRTVLQQAILNNGSILHGSGSDSPSWATRGMMLDAGRHFYPKDFLIELCSYMSFFKQNTFHLHLSDNLYNNPSYTRGRSLEVYARFRLWSDDEAVAGLNKYKNESYTRAEFDEIQGKCVARGVTIIPEIEAPGHALVIVQWKPQLGLRSDLSLLNLTHPETLPTMKAIWGTFLSWFQSKVVSIGADEYAGSPTDYNTFVNAMSGFIGSTSGKSIRIWGTFPPRYTAGYNNIYQNVSIQHWALFEDDPYWQYIKNNYSVVNSCDDFYVVGKYSGSYPQTVNIGKIFRGSPSRRPWYPNIFDTSNTSRNAPVDNLLIIGAIAAQWNDWGPNATVYSEAYYAWRQGIPALADKQWGGNLSESNFNKVFPLLQPLIPGQNLDRAIPSISATIFNYSFNDLDTTSMEKVTIPDLSPNKYDARTDCKVSENSILEVNSHCSLITPFASKGRNYTVKLAIKMTELNNPTNATIIAGGDSALMLTPALTLFASGNYYRLGLKLPLNEWAELSISGVGSRVFATVSSADGRSRAREEFQTRMGINGQQFRNAEIAIEAPLKQIGGSDCGWTGQLRSFSLSSQS